jgi:hypothetical protein
MTSKQNSNSDETVEETKYNFHGEVMERRPSIKTVEFPGADTDIKSTTLRNGYQLGRPSLVKKTSYEYRSGMSLLLV